MGGIFGGGGSPIAQVQPLPPPVVMPDPDDKAVKDSKRRALAAQQQRRGRQSTILSDGNAGSDLLGG